MAKAIRPAFQPDLRLGSSEHSRSLGADSRHLMSGRQIRPKIAVRPEKAPTVPIANIESTQPSSARSRIEPAAADQQFRTLWRLLASFWPSTPEVNCVSRET